MNRLNSSIQGKCRFKFNLQIEVSQGDWDSGTPFDLIHRLQRTLEDKQWFGDAKLISCKHTPYPGDISYRVNTLNGELIEPKLNL